MKIITISDTHNKHKKLNIPGADVIIHAGDFSSRGYRRELEGFVKWFGNLPHKYKILVPGNHDIGTDPDMDPKLSRDFVKDCKDHGIILLIDESCIIHDDDGNPIKVYGSPVQPTFGYGWGWNRDSEKITSHWDNIPDDTDILITHGPPHEILDKCFYGGTRAGCNQLLYKIEQVKPKMHVFGHIHEARGLFQKNETLFVNTSCLDLQYFAYNNNIYRFEWNCIIKKISTGDDF